MAIGRTNAAGRTINVPTYLGKDCEIIISTQQPSDPKENTIWVSSSLEVTRCVISDKRPDQESGLLFFLIASQGDNYIQLSHDPDVVVRLSGAEICVSGSNWRSVLTKVYKGGVWESLI